MIGIRTAARKKIDLPQRAVILTALIGMSTRALHRMFPNIRDIYLVGSRLRHREARDLDFVVTGDIPPKIPREVKIGKLKINLFWTPDETLETTVLEHGLGLDIIRWKRRAIQRGFRLNRYGLWRRGTLVAIKIVDIAQTLGLPVKPFLLATLKNPL